MAPAVALLSGSPAPVQVREGETAGEYRARLAAAVGLPVRGVRLAAPGGGLLGNGDDLAGLAVDLVHAVLLRVRRRLFVAEAIRCLRRSSRDRSCARNSKRHRDVSSRGKQTSSS